MTRSARTYVVCGCKPWNRQLFNEQLRILPGAWHYVGSPAELSLKNIQQTAPRYIFFLHWSWKVPEQIVQRYECVCFHMTDVPFGRGGSPLQNLILRGLQETKLTALRMNGTFDAGPVYLKQSLSLAGSAEEIYLRAGELSAAMIQHIINNQTKPHRQHGKSVIFRRRKPEDSELPTGASLVGLYDFIRMLDAEGYPRAFLKHAGFRFEFSRASLYDGRIIADVKITPAAAGETSK